MFCITFVIEAKCKATKDAVVAKMIESMTRNKSYEPTMSDCCGADVTKKLSRLYIKNLFKSVFYKYLS
ncbi:hypothetical protein GCM10007891_14430 [Methylophaga thalassica]|uniref:Uncharacterized protein n=1 Tax=Methylophaga thalassica TaxID=40223 RepID=A0ABQ5TVJ2_9GAMM|nr:hypothetical protein GCM10007891_14430 [Methylophaga thalassica]